MTISKEAREAAEQICRAFDVIPQPRGGYRKWDVPTEEEIGNLIQKSIDRALSSVKEEEHDECEYCHLVHDYRKTRCSNPNAPRPTPTTQEQPPALDERPPTGREWRAISDDEFSGSQSYPWLVSRPADHPNDSNVFACRMTGHRARWLAATLNELARSEPLISTDSTQPQASVSEPEAKNPLGKSVPEGPISVYGE